LSPAELTVFFNGSENRFALQSDLPYGIGRSRQNAICLLSEKISRNHAFVKQDESGAFFLFDLGSRNGTVLNGRLVRTPTQLRDGDLIMVGDAALTFHQGSETPKHLDDILASPGTILASDLADVTVLVMDIRSYTVLSQTIDPGLLAEVVGALNLEAGDLLNQSGVWSIKFIGDAVMAVWLNRNTPVVETLLGALDICLQIQTIADGFDSRFGLSERIRLGAGINSGTACIGNIGGANADYTALGEPVNRAFRLEAATRTLDCDLAFGPETYEHLSAAADVSAYSTKHECVLKGYVRPDTVYGMKLTDVRKFLSACTCRGTARAAES
jgi:adenylate cyclase